MGCAATPSLEGAAWYGQTGPVSAHEFPETASAGYQAVEVDFEVPTPQRAEALRQRGVQLPQVSSEMAEPRVHRDFVERRVEAVGFVLSTGAYLLYCEGLPLPVLVPESHVDIGLMNAVPLNASIYPDRDTALADMAAGFPISGHERFAWYRGAGGALIVPTLFSPATTPRIARAMLEVRKHLGETAQRELKVLLLTLTGTKVLQGVFSRTRSTIRFCASCLRSPASSTRAITGIGPGAHWQQPDSAGSSWPAPSPGCRGQSSGAQGA